VGDAEWLVSTQSGCRVGGIGWTGFHAGGSTAQLGGFAQRQMGEQQVLDNWLLDEDQQLRKKNSVTAHLPKGIDVQRGSDGVGAQLDGQ
jgi:hypothetical protein